MQKAARGMAMVCVGEVSWGGGKGGRGVRLRKGRERGGEGVRLRKGDWKLLTRELRLNLGAMLAWLGFGVLCCCCWTE